MEKFFKVKKDNIIYKKYYEWRLELPKIQEKWKEFCNLTGIEAESFVPGTSLYIIPTQNDLNKFEKYFCKDIFRGGLRKFKKSSPIQQDWERFARTNGMLIEKPNFVMDFVGRCFIGRVESQMFDYSGEIYCSVNADFHSLNFPEGYEEITGETFYHYYEIIKKGEKNENT